MGRHWGAPVTTDQERPGVGNEGESVWEAEV